MSAPTPTPHFTPYLGMDIRNCGAQLVHDETHSLPLHAPRLSLQQLQKVAGHKLHHDKQPVAHIKVIQKLDNVRVLHRTQKLNLAPASALHILCIGVIILRW